MAFWTPTPLNSMDLQYGQLVENNLDMARSMKLSVTFRPAVGGGAGLISD